jgi:hypothetical protein
MKAESRRVDYLYGNSQKSQLASHIYSHVEED